MEASRAARPRGEGRTLRLAPLRRNEPEPAAFEQLYNDYAPDVYRYALALLANPADAEDATQTTFLNAYRAFQRGERPRRPHNWLIAIAHNVCRMRWRQANSRPREVALEEAPEPVAPGPEHGPPELEEVLRALAGLSFNQRAALVMRELEGRSHAEIAEVLDLSVGAVEALIFRARRGLRLRRAGLGVLTTAPVPGSLASCFGAGGGAAAGGSAALGVGVALKAAAVVAAGALTAGAGYHTVGAVVASSRPDRYTQAQLQQVQRPVHAAGTPARSARGGDKPAAHGALQGTRPGGSAGSRMPVPTQSPAQPAASAPGQTAGPAPPPATTQAITSAVAAIAPAPLSPAPPPAVPLPPSPPLPVTVTTPTIPPPPNLP
jgi:RNA polymerase sigma-70 factor (ECF subfamily)